MALKLAVPLPEITCNDNFQVALARYGGEFPSFMMGAVLGLKALKATQELALCWKPGGAGSSTVVQWTQLKDVNVTKLYFPIEFPATNSPEIGLAHPFHPAATTSTTSGGGIFRLGASDKIQLEISVALFPVATKRVTIFEADWSPAAGFSTTASTITSQFIFTGAEASTDWTTSAGAGAGAATFQKSSSSGGA